MTVLSRLCFLSRQRLQEPSQIQYAVRYRILNKIQCRNLRQPRLNRRGGMNLAPESYVELSNEKSMGPGLLKSFLFSIGFSGCAFVGATLWQYENMRSNAKLQSWTGWAKTQWNHVEQWEKKSGDLKKHLKNWWNELPDGQKVFWPICIANLLVFLSWQHPGLQRTMFKYFCANPAARIMCWPMVLSTFSHYAIIHFGMNMFVLNTFSSSVGNVLGKEQFLAMYLSAGVMSSFASYIFKVGMHMPGPSLGASGAIMGLLGFFCTQFPDAQLGIIFLPGVVFSAKTALTGVMCMDACGIAFGWRMFDHAAHLGGALFGLAYGLWGPRYIWGNRETVMVKWHQLRTKFDSFRREK
ncbi:presenilin-associated rhomboid-like protein, mitochondrial isoform X5 [Oratosquilla oratoria]